MKRVFVCSPFRGDVEKNVAIARAACRQVLDEGDAPFAPHRLYPDILDDDVPAERERGVRAGIAWLPAADEVLVVGEPTEGMRQEIAAAELLGIPIRRVATLVALLALVVCGGCIGGSKAATACPPEPSLSTGGT